MGTTLSIVLCMCPCALHSQTRAIVVLWLIRTINCLLSGLIDSDVMDSFALLFEQQESLVSHHFPIGGDMAIVAPSFVAVSAVPCGCHESLYAKPGCDSNI